MNIPKDHQESARDYGILGNALQDEGKLEEAEAAYQSALQLKPDYPEAHNNLGNVLRDQGRLDEAEASYRRALNLKPDFPLPHNNLGNVLQDQGRLEESEASYRRALKLSPEFATAHNNLGNVLLSQGGLEDAVTSYRRALKLNPDDSTAHIYLGNVLWAQRRLEESEASYRRALKLKPDDPIGHDSLGNVLWAQGRLEEAEHSCRRALKLEPDYVLAHSNLANVLRDQGRLEESEASCRRALQLSPEFAAAHNNLGNVLWEQDGSQEAEASFRWALELKPDYPDAHNNLGNVLLDQCRLEEAEASYRRALELKPDYPDAHNNLGNVLLDQCRLEEAEVSYRRALELKPDYPDAHNNLALLLLLQARFQEGWEEHEWRWQATHFRSRKRDFSAPHWDGADLKERTILLHAEQGLGDTIQFIRYASFAASRGARVVVECPATLVDLLQGVEGIDSLVTRGSELPPFDLHCPLLSLPKVHGTTLETIPSQEHYLTPDPQKVAEWAKRIDQPGPKVGLVWAGSPTHKNDRNRSLGASHLQHLVDASGVSFVSLQVGARTSDIATLSDPEAITDLAPFLTDFSETAAAIANLDLVVCVDTAVAHLAGALGKPVWVMLPYSPDWRWFVERSDSPWYPTMKLYRQERPGAWLPVLDRIRVDLLTQTAGRR